MTAWMIAALYTATATGTASAASVERGPSAFQPAIEEVVVTGSRTPHSLADTPVATEVISRQEIEATGANNAAEILEQRTGMEITTSFRGSTIRMMGLDSEYVL